MKKIIYILFLCFSVNFTFSQYFDLTPAGFISLKNDFTVLNFDNISKEKLYKKALVYFNTIYRSPQNVISSVENETITINGIKEDAIHRNNINVFDMNYTIVLMFKDNKIRINSPTFSLHNSIDSYKILHIKWTRFSPNGGNLGIFGRKNKLKSKRAKKELEDFFNNYIKRLNVNINSKDSDW